MLSGTLLPFISNVCFIDHNFRFIAQVETELVVPSPLAHEAHQLAEHLQVLSLLTELASCRVKSFQCVRLLCNRGGKQWFDLQVVAGGTSLHRLAVIEEFEVIALPLAIGGRFHMLLNYWRLLLA